MAIQGYLVYVICFKMAL